MPCGGIKTSGVPNDLQPGSSSTTRLPMRGVQHQQGRLQTFDAVGRASQLMVGFLGSHPLMRAHGLYSPDILTSGLAQGLALGSRDHRGVVELGPLLQTECTFGPGGERLRH